MSDINFEVEIQSFKNDESEMSSMNFEVEIQFISDDEFKTNMKDEEFFLMSATLI